MTEDGILMWRVRSVAWYPSFLIREAPKVDWQWMFVVGILIGAFIAAKSGGSFKWQSVPDMWQARFGSSIRLRAVFAFIGGIIAMFGARLADGCPSGHGLSTPGAWD